MRVFTETKISDSHTLSERSETDSHRSEEPSGDTNHRAKFERANELFMLRSELNQAHLTIHKLGLQQQQQLQDEERFYSRIEAEKQVIE
jgi:hypothetical protein